MFYMVGLILVVLLWGVMAMVFFRQKAALKRRVQYLEKELDIQESNWQDQKEQYANSVNHLYSAQIIITEMLEEIDGALKSEEGDLSDKILRIIFEKAKELLKPEKCVLFKIEADKNSYSCLYSFGYKQEQLAALSSSLDANSSFLGWSAATGRFLSFVDAEQDSLLSHILENDPLKCRYSQPLKVDNKVKAVLCVGSLLQYMEKDNAVRLFSILSDIASVALSNASLTQGLRELSVRDSLTGLYNHSYFQRWLEGALVQASKNNGVLSLAMVDLDYFKRINDTHGHQAGDLILKAISALLNNAATSDYLCARYGGEEFALVFLGKDINQSRLIMEDVRKRIKDKIFEIQDKRIGLTISVGLAEARFSEGKKVNKQDFIEAADQALYKAKTEGRNRVVVADKPSCAANSVS